MNAADLVLLVLLAAAVFFALRHIRRMRKSGHLRVPSGPEVSFCIQERQGIGGRQKTGTLIQGNCVRPSRFRTGEELMPQSVRSPCRAQTPL